MSADDNLKAPPASKKLPLIVKILGGILLALGAFAGYVVNQPDEFRVERSKTIAASPEAVFAHVNDFHKWEAWSPWAKLDPKAKNSFEGSDAGENAVFKWAGNDEVGVGAMTIKISKPSEYLRIQLDFEKPMKDTSTVEFLFKPQGEQTEVTWTMFGRHANFISKAMCLVMNMDKMIGGKFEEGLASLKKTVEAEKPMESEKSTESEGSIESQNP